MIERIGFALKVLVAWGVTMTLGGCATMDSQTPEGVQQPHRLETRVEQDVRIGYLLYLPPGYGEDPAHQWPLVMFLHGLGERGDDLERVKLHGPPKLIEAGQHFPFLVVSPQCPDTQWWPTEDLIPLLDHLMREYRVDPDRVYLTGLSMGGYGTWQLAQKFPERFAAIAPICGGGIRALACRLKDMPIWAFHGAKDTVVPLSFSEEMVEAVRRCGGEAKLTVYPDATHDSWTVTYENPELYEWLLSYRRAPTGRN